MSTLKEICKEQTEMIDEMRRNIKELNEENEKLSEQYNKMIAERNSLIDDLSWYKSKVSRLERENERLRVKSDSFFERWKFKSAMYTDLSKELDKYKSLLSEFSQHIGNKPSSSTYKYFRAKLDELGIKEGE